LKEQQNTLVWRINEMMKGLYHILVCEKGNSESGGYLLSPAQAKAGNQALEQPVAFLQMDGAGG